MRGLELSSQRQSDLEVASDRCQRDGKDLDRRLNVFSEARSKCVTSRTLRPIVPLYCSALALARSAQAERDRVMLFLISPVCETLRYERGARSTRLRNLDAGAASRLALFVGRAVDFRILIGLSGEMENVDRKLRKLFAIVFLEGMYRAK
ncbi:hypothetical protein EVAR_74758_1 [Eumeta japonica]|uniref:Uncharacterized protein n=1 Tax=Eumeta variegata TaxID=151549 RepID=A0A4C1SPC8_EUMVA|nr:hypothetical protein EVAR_74758_1 [Eumeta japonica]